MTYKTLMVHLELNADNDGVLKIAGELAARFDARVIAIAACRPIQVPVSDGLYMADAIEQDRIQIGKELAAAEQQFRTVLEGRVKNLEWRSRIICGPLADYVADQARSADLIITARDIGADLLDESRRVKLGDLIMSAGRPVLIVPPGITTLPMRHVMIGWKETREARRAVADALPLLQAAGNATVLAVTSQDRCSMAQANAKDVAAFLQQHQIQATASAVVASGTEASFLHATLLDRRCDLLVAGAYGHNRVREWVFGGVTEDVLLDPAYCVLISH